jgi:GTP-binding protein
VPALEPKLSSPKAKKILSSILSYYWDTSPPTTAQLSYAEKFFLEKPPVLLFSTMQFRTVTLTSVPEVAFLGRSNVGKSSLLNALFGETIAWTSSQPGRTRSMNAFAIGGEDSIGNKGKINVLDMPGYGMGSRAEWGQEVTKYLVGRKEYISLLPLIYEGRELTGNRLKRAFLLVDSLHGLKDSDAQILELFRHNAVPHQVILSKVDRVLLPKRTKAPSKALLESRAEDLRQLIVGIRKKIQPVNDGPPALGEILTCCSEIGRFSSLSMERDGTLGINAIRWAILVATGAVPGRKTVLSKRLPKKLNEDID